MKACNLLISFEALREKLGMPEGVQVVHLGRIDNTVGSAFITLHGIGPDVSEGGMLMAVNGRVSLKTEGGLEWQIN